MKAYVLTFFVALMLGAAGGVALGIFVYPYLFLTDIVANEKVPPQQPAPEAQRKGITAVSKGAMARLAAHPWPGNLRELDNVIRGATIRCQGSRILERDLPPALDQVLHRGGAFPTLEEVQRRHVEEALRVARGNKSRAAELLGVHRNTLGAWVREVS